MRSLLLVVAVFASGCFQPDLTGRPCRGTQDCLEGWACAAGLCVEAAGGKDAGGTGAPERDGGLPADGLDAGPPALALYAVEPPLVGPGDAITLHGRFETSPTVTVRFPGDVRVDVTPAGRNRVRVPVPEGATTGLVFVEDSDQRSDGLWFRRSSFVPQLGTFSPAYEQAPSARAVPATASPREAHASVVVGRHLYLFGGKGFFALSGRRSVERARVFADGTLGRFEADEGLLEGRAYPAIARVGRRVILLGGRDGRALRSTEVREVLDDGRLGPPAAGPPLVEARLEASAVVAGRFLYVIGGRDDDALSSIERAELRVDGSLGPFARLDAALSRRRAGALAAVVGDELVVVGGSDGNDVTGSVERAPLLEDGDLAGGFELSPGPLPVAAARATALRLGRSFCVIGGAGPTGRLSAVQCASVGAGGALGPFEIAAPSLALARESASLAVLGNRVTVVGGEGTPALEHARFDGRPALGPFAAGPALSPALYVGCAVAGDHLYVIGGTDAFAGGGTQLARIERALVAPDGALGPFEPAGALPEGRAGMMTAVTEDALLLLGGETESGGQTDVLRAPLDADGALGPFSLTETPLPSARVQATAAIVGDTLHVMGGSTTDGAAATVERARIEASSSLSWDGSAPLQVGRALHQSAVVGGVLHVVGGVTFAGGPPVALADVEVALLSPAGLGGFASRQPLLAPRWAAGTVVLGDELYLLGGLSDSGAASATDAALRVRYTDTGFASFSVSGVLPAAVKWGHCAVALGDHLHVIGGAGGPAATTLATRAHSARLLPP